MHLPFGWRAVEDHEPDAPVSIRYELLDGDRVERGRHTVCMPGRTWSRRCAGWRMQGGRWQHTRSSSSRSARRTTSSYTPVLSAGKAAPSSCPAPVSPARQRSYRHGSRRVRRTTPMSSRFSTAPDACIRSPVRWRSETDRRVNSSRAGRGTVRRDGDDAPARRTRPGDLVPGRGPLATAPLDAGPDAARADAPHRRRSREPGALDAHPEAGGERWRCVRRPPRRGSPAGSRGSQTRRTPVRSALRRSGAM